MKRYSIIYTHNARIDIQELYFFIVSEYKTYRTAERYVDGLEKAILQLINSAESFEVQTNPSLSRYGLNVRRINYKRMAIIHTVQDKTVFIHRIIPASMISGL